MKAQDYIRRIQAITAKRCPRSINPKTRLGEPWKVIAHRILKDSLEIALHIPNGYSTDDLKQETDSISASVGKLVSIRDHRGAAVICIYMSDFPTVIKASRDMLSTLPSKRHILVGYDRNNDPIFHNFRVPHLLIAGMSGYGKTDFIRWVLFQLIARHTPEQLRIDIIDMKGFSFLPFRNIPHIRHIARDIPTALSVTSYAKRLMHQRSNIVWNNDDRDGTTNSFQWHIVLVDEAAQIAPDQIRDKMQRKLAQEIDADLGEIARVGREAKLGLLYCTQRPDAHTINPQVKAVCEASIGFRTKTQSNSEIIIDRPGLERLPIGKPGRIIYAATEDIYAQVPYVGDDDEWGRWLAPYKREVNPNENNRETEEYNGDLD